MSKLFYCERIGPTAAILVGDGVFVCSTSEPPRVVASHVATLNDAAAKWLQEQLEKKEKDA